MSWPQLQPPESCVVVDRVPQVAPARGLVSVVGSQGTWTYLWAMVMHQPPRLVPVAGATTVVPTDPTRHPHQQEGLVPVGGTTPASSAKTTCGSHQSARLVPVVGPLVGPGHLRPRQHQLVPVAECGGFLASMNCGAPTSTHAGWSQSQRLAAVPLSTQYELRQPFGWFRSQSCSATARVLLAMRSASPNGLAPVVVSPPCAASWISRRLRRLPGAGFGSSTNTIRGRLHLSGCPTSTGWFRSERGKHRHRAGGRFRPTSLDGLVPVADTERWPTSRPPSRSSTNPDQLVPVADARPTPRRTRVAGHTPA